MYDYDFLMILNAIAMLVNLLCGMSVRNSGYKVAQRARELDKIERWLDIRAEKIDKIIESRNIIL
jgi:hypothetical protein